MMSTESKFQVQKKIEDTLGEVYGVYHQLGKLEDSTKEWLESEGIDVSRKQAHDAAGINEDWPNGRGIFIDDNKEFVVLVNFEDHIQIITICNGGDYTKSLGTLLKTLSRFEKMGYARHTTLGFLTASPRNVGTGLGIECRVKLAKDHDAEDLESYEGTYSCKITKLENKEYEICFNKTLAKNLTENEAFNELDDCIKRLSEGENDEEEAKGHEPEVKVDKDEVKAHQEAPKEKVEEAALRKEPAKEEGLKHEPKEIHADEPKHDKIDDHAAEPKQEKVDHHADKPAEAAKAEEDKNEKEPAKVEKHIEPESEDKEDTKEDKGTEPIIKTDIVEHKEVEEEHKKKEEDYKKVEEVHQKEEKDDKKEEDEKPKEHPPASTENLTAE